MRAMKKVFAIVTLVVLASAVTAQAQTIQVIEDAKLPRFDVVSVKPSGGSVTRVDFGVETGDLVNVVMFVFGVQAYQMANTSELIGQGRFTIDTRMPEGARPLNFPLMVRTLLIDQFNFVTTLKRA